MSLRGGGQAASSSHPTLFTRHDQRRPRACWRRCAGRRCGGRRSAPAVVVSTSTGRLGDRCERPPVAGVGEPVVLHVPDPNALGLARGAGNGSGPGERTEAAGGREPGGVITDLAKDSCREDGTQSWRGAELLGGVVLIELGGHRHLEVGDGRLHRLDHVHQSAHGVAERSLDGRRLAQGRLVEVVQDRSASPPGPPRPLRLSRVTTRLWVSFRPCAGVGSAPSISSAALCVSTGKALRALG